ncbi:MAG: amidohydrolase family protein [Cyclobacteriaceae bacterium]
MRNYSSHLFIFAIFLNFQNAFSQSAMNLDVLFIGALVYDGITLEGQEKDVGIKGDRIQFIGEWKQSDTLVKQVIDAEGLILAPGFIDPHTHIEGDLDDRDGRANIAFLMQGVTTVFGGNDGGGPLPIGRKLWPWPR